MTIILGCCSDSCIYHWNYLGENGTTVTYVHTSFSDDRKQTPINKKIYAYHAEL